MKRSKIAVIGAGMSALSFANKLKNQCDITLFDKSYKPGGRLSTRKIDETPLDFGAQYFTARTEQFNHFLQPAISAGVIEPWVCEFVELSESGIKHSKAWTEQRPHYVGCPTMRSFAEFYAEGLDIRYRSQITSCVKEHGGWQLTDFEGQVFSGFDWVVSAVPPVQSDAIFHNSYARLNNSHKPMQACFALMLVLNEAPDVTWQAACVKSDLISWISICSSKPHRSGSPSVVVLSTNQYADDHVEQDIEVVKKALLAKVEVLLGLSAEAIRRCDIHRWRYANIPVQSGESFYLDVANKKAACGDWFIQGRVENAFLSGWRLADRIEGLLC